MNIWREAWERPWRMPGRGLNGAVLRASAAVAVAGVVVKLAATAKEFVVAGVYGRSDAMDALITAALLPALLVNLIAESMNQALVPTLIRVRQREGNEAAQRLYSCSLLALGGLLVGVTVAMALLAPAFFPLLAARYAPEKLALALRLYYALLPLVAITGIATNCTAVLNTLDRFVWPALAPLVISVAIVAGALLLGGRMGIWAMVVATLLGSLLHAAAMAYACHRYGYSMRLRGWQANEATREVARQYGPVLLSSLVASAGLLVDQAMAALLPAGSVSALAYANRFVAVILSLLAGALSTALTPYLSRLAAAGAWAECRQTIRAWVRLSALVSIPLTLLLVAGSQGLVRVAYEHGAFGPRDTATVFPVLSLYALQIPFFVCSRVYYRFLLARRRTDLIFYCGLINLALDVVLNLVLMRLIGVAGIALATSLWTVSSFLFLRFWSDRLLRQEELPA